MSGSCGTRTANLGMQTKVLVPSPPTEIERTGTVTALPELTQILRPKLPRITVPKEGGAYFDAGAVADLKYAESLWAYYAKGVQEQVENYNSKIEKQRQDKKPDDKKWWQLWR